MKKRWKTLVGLCLIAALAFGGVRNYAHAFSLYVTDGNGRRHEAECLPSINQTSGSAYTASVETSYCYCSVSVTCTWRNKGGFTMYSNGNSAGGMHGAEVTIAHSKDANQVGDADTYANHIVRETITGKSESMGTIAFWPY